MRTLIETLGIKPRKETHLKLYKALAGPTSLYGNDSYTRKATDTNRKQ
jgi:hypothetical protein